MSISRKLKNAASESSSGGGGGGGGTYVDDVFSTYLYEGNGGNQTITNGIDLAGEGGLVWVKNRTSGALADRHVLTDTEATKGQNGFYVFLSSNLPDALNPADQGNITTWNSDGFTSFGNYNWNNKPSERYVSWTFRKAKNFFDVVTYTGDGVAGREIPHNLGIKPGAVILKSTSMATNWIYATNFTASNWLYLTLDQTNAGLDLSYGNTIHSEPDESAIYVDGTTYNLDGEEYVAYLFAHDDSDESMIKCGSWTSDPNQYLTQNIELGFEPQWVLVKDAGAAGDWYIYDTMRGIPPANEDDVYNNPAQALIPNSSSAESGMNRIGVHSTGFTYKPGSKGQPYIYMAIRRPNKPAEEFDPEELFAPTYAYQYDIEGNTSSSNGIHGYLGNPTDLYIQGYLSGNALNAIVRSRMTGSNYLITSATSAETTGTVNFWDNNVGAGFESSNSINTDLITYNFRRAPGFFDVVAYGPGNETIRTIPHNLGAVPEMMWFRRRNISSSDWYVYHKDLDADQALTLNSNRSAFQPSPGTPAYHPLNETTPTDSLITLGKHSTTNNNGDDYIAYLFASVPGISKVGSYTGQLGGITIDCGFTNGARLVLIKRTDAAGDWYMSTGPDLIKTISLNSTEPAKDSYYFTPDPSGFHVNSSGADKNANIEGAEYIYYAIAN